MTDSNPFRHSDKVRENRQLATTEEVLSVTGCMVSTYEGRTYHWTKLVRDEAL